tara:strand:+ start:54 stop:269 length:216 start_codon:yes stop_codon:yes gene_type:complete
MNKKIILLTILFKTIFITSAHAYLDPGSGSIILQAILGFIAAGIASISFYWTKFKNFLVKIFKKNKKKTIE